MTAASEAPVLSADEVTDENNDPDKLSKPRETFCRRTIVDYWRSFDPSQRRLGRAGYGVHSRAIGPTARLWDAMQRQEPVLVITRGLREPRASLHGRLVAFDRYWNLILSNVTEYLVNLPKSSLSGHYKPSRSRKRKMQRQAKQIQIRRHQAMTATTTEADGEAVHSSFPQLTCPMEIGDFLRLHQQQPGTGYEDTPGYVPCCQHASGFQCSHTPDQVVGKTDMAVNTDNPCWQASVAMLTERTNHLLTVKCPGDYAAETASPAAVEGLQPGAGCDATAQSSQPTLERHSQLFVRGANVILINFIKDLPS